MCKMRIASIILCFCLVFSILPQKAFATVNDSGNDLAVGDISYEGNFACCYYNGTSYRYCIVINTSSGAGCFSIVWLDNSDYVMEYYFSVSSDDLCVNDTAFWSGLIADCISNSDEWNVVDLSSSITPVVPNNTSAYASSAIDREFRELLIDIFGTSEYTGKIIATKNINGLNFHIHEDFYFMISEKQHWVTNVALSVASIIVGIFAPLIISIPLSLFTIYHGVTVPSGTEIGTHNVVGQWERYVKRDASSVWLTTACRNVGYDGYYISSLPEPCAIDTASREETYDPPKAYYDNYNAQFTDGYNEYIG
ncbi:MAG: hypothetical protein E7466_01200 [Ruminococcaceae bacterium]|nr:hypothetical protein [Oscillospiraceae bacterium]MBQ3215603.1 hypothetical protein [Oscillospiraceae bacterium]